MANNKKIIINYLIDLFGSGSVNDFAEMLGVKANTVSTWKARGNIDYDLVIAKCEGVNGHWLLTGEGEPIITKTPPEISRGVKEEEISLNDLVDLGAVNAARLQVIEETLASISSKIEGRPVNEIFAQMDKRRTEILKASSGSDR